MHRRTSSVTRRDLLKGTVAGAASLPLVSVPRVARAQEEITVRWVDAMAGPAEYNRTWFEAYEQQHPNVTIEYTLVPVAELDQTIQLYLQSDTPPDVFATTVPAGQLVEQSIVQPLDPYITEEWKSHFPSDIWIEGGLVFDGSIFSYPHSGTRQSEGLLWYNKDLFRTAGLDPERPPATWSELREYARQITEAGNGQYFGLALPGKLPGSVGHFASVMATSSGDALGPIGGGRSTTGGIDWHTGNYVFTNDLYAEATELLREIETDGSIFPGWGNLSPQDCMARMAQGLAAMFSWGSYVVGQMRTGDYAEFDLGFAPPPTKGSERFHLNTDPALPRLYLNAKSQHPDVAADVIMFRSSPEYFRGYVEEVQVQPSPMPQINAEANVTPQFAAALAFFEEWIRYQPMPAVRNPAQTQLMLQMDPVQPDFGDRITAAVAGDIEDIRASLQEYNQQLTTERDSTIALLEADGVPVSLDDWVFPNWDRSKDYTDEFYQELPDEG